MAEESELGKQAKQYMEDGELVPDELINEVIAERLDSGEADDGFLLDGFPRTTGQAEMLEETLEGRGRELYGGAPDRRARRRGGASPVRPPDLRKDNHVYHVEFDPPKNEGVCDQDGSRLIQRDDDSPRPSASALRSTTTRPSR